jgi:hypothetical protein
MESLLSAVRSTKQFDELDIDSIKAKLSAGESYLPPDNMELTDEALKKLGFKRLRNSKCK